MCTDRILVERQLVRSVLNMMMPCFICFTDLKKTSNSISRYGLLRTLEKCVVLSTILFTVHSFHAGMQSEVRIRTQPRKVLLCTAACILCCVHSRCDGHMGGESWCTTKDL